MEAPLHPMKDFERAGGGVHGAVGARGGRV
jgi:hypothetical protein